MSWQIDSAHSHIQFAVKHMMISTVRGGFGAFSGTINFDEKNPEQTTVFVEIDAASISTDSTDRDNHLRSPDFLKADEYPYLTFKSKRVERKDSRNGRLIGDLTIRDITREVVLDVHYAGKITSPWGTTSAGFSATAEINRKDWNLTWNQALEAGGVLVGETIKINIELELIEQPEMVMEAAAD